MAKYRLTRLIEAQQWFPGCRAIPGLVLNPASMTTGVNQEGQFVPLVPGDWVVKTFDGTYFRCPDAAFREKYERVD